MMATDRIIVDLKTCGMTLTEALAEIRKEALANPNEDIFVDGDAHAIVGRRRAYV